MADVVMLTEPKYDPAKYKMIQPKADADWYKKSYVASKDALKQIQICLLYTSPSPRDYAASRMPSSA